MPALLTRMSMRPPRTDVACPASEREASALPSSSAITKSARPPREPMPSATCAPRWALWPEMTTCAPWAANASAIARPMLLVAPVTRAVLPCSRPAMICSPASLYSRDKSRTALSLIRQRRGATRIRPGGTATMRGIKWTRKSIRSLGGALAPRLPLARDLRGQLRGSLSLRPHPYRRHHLVGQPGHRPVDPVLPECQAAPVAAQPRSAAADRSPGTVYVPARRRVPAWRAHSRGAHRRRQEQRDGAWDNPSTSTSANRADTSAHRRTPRRTARASVPLSAPLR